MEGSVSIKICGKIYLLKEIIIQCQYLSLKFINFAGKNII